MKLHFVVISQILCICAAHQSYFVSKELLNLPKMSDKQKVDLGLLEEDDEFEEFPAENWGTEDADEEEVSVWEDNWEDDIVQDDFSQQLRQQLEKLKDQNKA